MLVFDLKEQSHAAARPSSAPSSHDMSSRVLTCCSACSSVMSRCACTRRHMRDGAAAAALPPPPPLLSAASPRSPSAFEILASGVTSRRNACLGAGNSSFHLFPPRSCCGCQALSASAPQPHPRSARIYEAGGEGGGGGGGQRCAQTLDMVSINAPTLSLKERMRSRNAPHWS